MSLLKSTLKHLKRNAPLILTISASLGVVITATVAGQATLQAKIRYDEEASMSTTFQAEATPVDVFKLTWDLYIPSAILAGLTIGCIVYNHNLMAAKAASLAAAYSLAQETFKAYREKVTDQISGRKDRDIHARVGEDRIRENPPSNLIIFDENKVPCYDSLSGRYFHSTMEHIRRAENKVNLKVIGEMYASVNDFYREVGLDPTTLGEEIGWSTDRPLELEISPVMGPDDRPCIHLDYRTQPQPGYWRSH